MDAQTVNEVGAAIGGLVMTWGLRVLGALAVLLVGWWVARRVRAIAHRGLERSPVDDTLRPFGAGIAYWAVLLFVGVAVLGLFGIPTASVIAVLGAAGLAVGLAFQGTLSNFAAGVMLLVFRPIRHGDVVEVGGVRGRVAEVGIFATLLDTPDNVRVTIPNSRVFGETIKNYTANATRRIDLVMGVGYDDDLSVAEETIRRVLAADDRVLDEPEPQVAVSELGDSSVGFVVRPWCRTEDYWTVRFDLTRALKEELEAAGCNIPYPQRDVHLFREETPAA